MQTDGRIIRWGCVTCGVSGLDQMCEGCVYRVDHTAL